MAWRNTISLVLADSIDIEKVEVNVIMGARRAVSRLWAFVDSTLR